jgi:hypothetical protein
MERGKTLGRHSVRHKARTPGRAKPKDDGSRSLDREFRLAHSRNEEAGDVSSGIVPVVTDPVWQSFLSTRSRAPRPAPRAIISTDGTARARVCPGKPGAFGNVLRHAYDAVDPGRIWEIATRDLLNQRRPRWCDLAAKRSVASSATPGMDRGP